MNQNNNHKPEAHHEEVERYGGHIEARSLPDRGSTFASISSTSFLKTRLFTGMD